MTASPSDSPKPSQDSSNRVSPLESGLENVIFASRWLQAPLYVGLVFATLLYSVKFFGAVWKLMREMNELTLDKMMIDVLTLVDITMIANLIAMVVIGGYSIFVSRLNLEHHPDRPEWLEHTNAASLKIKLATALVGVSGIHLLKSFIELEESHNPNKYTDIMWQVIIHVTFLLSSLLLAMSERMLPKEPH